MLVGVWIMAVRVSGCCGKFGWNIRVTMAVVSVIAEIS